MNNCGIANFVHKRNACRFIISPNQDGMIAFLHDEGQMQKQRRKSANPLNSIEHMLAPFERESFHCQTFSMSSLTNPCLQGLRLEWGCWSWEGWGGLAHHPHQRQMIVPKIHLDHDESRHRSWKFLSKFATHQTIKLPIDSAINGDHLRPPALAALLALLAAQPEAINWERPRIDGNSQQHASALEKAYDTHCLWILHPKWLNRAAETRSKQKTLRPKNSSASPDLEKNQSTHAIVTALMENWSPTTQLLYRKGWLAEGGLHISVEPTLPPRSFKAFELNIFAFQMGASGNKSHDRSVSS